jgi:hypothetical protein
MMRSAILFLTLGLVAISGWSLGYRPVRFGPYLQQSLAMEGGLTSRQYVLPNGNYRFQAGWVEPIGLRPWGWMRGTYLEVQGKVMLSPFESDVGTAFNLKPLRWVDIGLTYNRLLFNHSLVGFKRPDDQNEDWTPPTSQWRLSSLVESDKSVAGADVFSFQGNFLLDLWRWSFRLGGSRSLWDVETRQKDFLFEYESGFLIQRRDRINSLTGQIFLDLQPYVTLSGLTLRGMQFQAETWFTDQTDLKKTLFSTGFEGIRWGRNDSRRYRGLDARIGYWSEHPQLESAQDWERLHFQLNWLWNSQLLNLGGNL